MLYAVPASSFAAGGEGAVDLAALVAMAVAAERRGEKEMATATDRARRCALCGTIKRVTAAAATKTLADADKLPTALAEVVAFRIDDDLFVDLVAAEWQRDPSIARRELGALGAAFLRPEDVAQHARTIAELGDAASAKLDRRRAFLRACARRGCGVVEVADPEVPPRARMHDRAERPHAALPPPTESIGSARSLEERLAAFAAGGPAVSFGSGARHGEIADALHALAHGHDAGSLPILYSDGSRAADFPVGCLRQRDEPTPDEALRLGLMSMRHPELDLVVDGYWFRNKAVSQPRTLADTDAFCYRESRARLRELHGGGVRLVELYHTGYEPAVIGCYRALVEHQRENDAPLAVRPMFLGNRSYSPGPTWSGAGRSGA